MYKLCFSCHCSLITQCHSESYHIHIVLGIVSNLEVIQCLGYMQMLYHFPQVTWPPIILVLQGGPGTNPPRTRKDALHARTCAQFYTSVDIFTLPNSPKAGTIACPILEMRRESTECSSHASSTPPLCPVAVCCVCSTVHIVADTPHVDAFPQQVPGAQPREEPQQVMSRK
jgi:hypothetical protein